LSEDHGLQFHVLFILGARYIVNGCHLGSIDGWRILTKSDDFLASV